MANRLFIIFTDFDGVIARISTWGNDTKFATACAGVGVPEMRDLDIYALNRLDRMCRAALGENDELWLVSTSMWKRVFDVAKNRKFIADWAGLKKMKIVHKNRKSFDRFSRWEPQTRVQLILWYLSKYKPDGYVVFDDQYENALRDQFHKHFILCDRMDGLGFDQLSAFVKILSQWKSDDKKNEEAKALETLVACI